MGCRVALFFEACHEHVREIIITAQKAACTMSLTKNVYKQHAEKELTSKQDQKLVVVDYADLGRA